MKSAWKWIVAIMAVCLSGALYIGLNSSIASASDEYTVTYYDVVNNVQIGVNTYDTGEALDFNWSDTGTSSGTLTPVGQQFGFFVDTDNKMCHEISTSTTCSTSNFSTTSPTVYVVLTSDYTTLSGSGQAGSASSGVYWLLDEGNLYVIGSGTYTPNDDTYTAVSTSATISSIENFTFPISKVSVMYGDLMNGGTYGVNPPSVGQEKTLDGTFYEYTAPTDSTWTLDSDINTRDSQTIDTHYSGCVTPIKWADIASSVTTAYIGDDITLSGNCSFLFNGYSGSTAATGRTKIPASTYSNLTTVYFYPDTSGVTTAAAMFARCHNLTNIYVDETKNFSACKDTAYMFFADSKLNNGTDSLVDNMNLTGSAILTDTAYMFAGCSEIVKPNVKGFVMTGVTSAEGMFYGCEKARLTFTDSTSNAYIGGWNLSALQDGMFMFMGRDLAVDSSTVLSTSNIPFMSNLNPGYGTLPDSQVGSVIDGAADISMWGSLSNLKTAAYMFAQNDTITSCAFGSSYAALEDISDMFLRCDNLATITMTGTTMPNLKAAQHTFTMCGGSAGKANISLTAPNLNNIAFIFYGSTFSTISLTGSNLTGIVEATAAFANCEDLTTVKASDQSFSNLEHARFMFFGDDALSTLQVSSWDMGACTDASFMFMDDILLTSLDTSSWNIGDAPCNMENFAYNCGASDINLSGAGANITNIAFAFAKMPNLTSFTAPSDMTACTNAFGAWSNDESLTGTINLPSSIATDLRGMFYSDSALTTSGLSVGSFISSPATYLSYAFAGCDNAGFTSLNLSGATTKNALYMDCLCDGDTYLTSVTMGANTTPSAATSLGAAFRNCDLSDSGASNIITAFADSDTVTDMYAMFEGNDDITKMDLSGMDFSSASDLSRFAYGCNKLGVITEDEALTVPSSSLPKITIPATFTSAVTDSSKGMNIFYVVKDGDTSLDASDPSDDVITYLDVSGSSLPTYLKSYSWTGDNRRFSVLKSKTIDGENTSSHVFSSPSDDNAVLKAEGVSTLTINGTQDSLKYSWESVKDDGTTSALSDTDSEYTAPAATYAGGIYTVTATFYPESLDPAYAAGKLFGTEADFLLGADVTSITATYKGDDVPVTKDYSKDDVEVIATLANGDKITLSSDDWTPSSTTITKKGANNFTASYKDSKGNTLTAPFTVNGTRTIGSIVSTYTGPAILVGSNYNTNDVTTMAYYIDDTSKSEGFEVTPEYSSLKVTSLGDNTFTATYTDTSNNNNKLTSSFVVTGYKTISRIEADYGGNSILVGNKYNKDDVTVKVYYADGSGSFTTKDFSVNSLSVSYEGSNTYTATYRDPYGNTFTDTFTVTGYKDASASSTTASTSPYASVSQIYGNGTTTLPSTGTLVTATGGGVAEDGSVATATGVVQTGTTGKYIIWILLGAALLGSAVTGIIIKRRLDRREEEQ